MTRLVVLVLLAWLLWLALRRARSLFLSSPRGREARTLWRLLRQLLGAGPGRAATRPDSSWSTPAGAAPPGSQRRPTHLVRCSGCGTHVPENTARRGAGALVFCSEECERRAAGP
ncbi:MAG TPA: hypothetical protein VMS86_09140 [Thermoanaerobaculia bacterium]|nr:hypothetical protein [Thermoanaerobaculia bacterium]